MLITRLLLTGILLTVFTKTQAQAEPPAYYQFVQQADSFYAAKEYKNSGEAYSRAFKANNGKATKEDRYNAACSWALAGIADSAFYQLELLANTMDLSGVEQVSADPDLVSLHENQRWENLLLKISDNKAKKEVNLNKPLAALLDSIYNEDQLYRMQLDTIENKFGRDSKEIRAQWKTIMEKDSLNLLAVTSVLDNMDGQVQMLLDNRVT